MASDCLVEAKFESQYLGSKSVFCYLTTAYVEKTARRKRERWELGSEVCLLRR